MNVQPIEGFTPDMIWTALIVIIGIGTLIVLFDKVADVFRKQKRRKEIEQGPEGKLADEISQKVLEKMEPRFAEIDRKLANDKARIDEHTRVLGALSGRTDGLETGQKALCRGVLALLGHELHDGNKDEIEQAQHGINEYLIEK